MRRSLEFLLGVLDSQEHPSLSCEDLENEHAPVIRSWRAQGFLNAEPVMHPVPSCPLCGEGVPYAVAGEYRCSRCGERIERKHLLLWELNRERFLQWLAHELHLHGGIRRIDDTLWQLGSWERHDAVYECFYLRHGLLSEAGRRRLEALRRALLLHISAPPPEAATLRLPSLCLLELLRPGDPLGVMSLEGLLLGKGTVRFDSASGTLKIGEIAMGEVPVGSRDYYFLESLARQIDRFVPYADIKDFVLERAGSRDTTDEATFCQRLKNRIKKQWIPRIDLLIATTNKGDGYRLRGSAELQASALG